MQNIKISINDDKSIPIEPDVIMNRFDLQQSCDYIDLCIESQTGVKRVLVRIDKSTAEIGCFLMDLSEKEFEALICYIFGEYKNIKRIRYNNALNCFGAFKENPQRYIDLPDSEDELNERLARKNRYNLKREKRLISDNIGEYRMIHYSVTETPDEVMLFYFMSKKDIYKRDFHMTTEEYLTGQNVTDVYELRTDSEILAVALSCEQCKYTYFENFSYNTKYPKLSLGSIIYNMYLCELIQKGIKRVYLGSDLYDYKKHYGSIREQAYIGEVYRSKLFTDAVGALKAAYRTVYRKIKKRK